jgi:hypothetical protein
MQVNGGRKTRRGRRRVPGGGKGWRSWRQRRRSGSGNFLPERASLAGWPHSGVGS